MCDMVTKYLDRTKGLLYSGVIKRLSTPIEVYIELTNVCNLQCIYCYKKGINTNGPRYFDVNLLRKVLDDLHSETVEPILFVLEGGEPLLHPQLSEIIQCIKYFNYPIDILTNGELLNSTTANEILPYIDLSNDDIQISFDGISDDALKNRKNSYKKIVDNILYLNLHKVYPRINVVVTKYNVDSILDFLDYINKNIKVKSVSLNSVIGRKNVPIQATLEKRKHLSAMLDNKRYNFGVFKSLLHNVCDSSICMETHGTAEDVHIRCTALTGKLCLSVEGEVYPCVFYENMTEPIGSLSEKGILEIWNSREARRFLTQKATNEAKCMRCSLNKKCTQICAGSIL